MASHMVLIISLVSDCFSKAKWSFSTVSRSSAGIMQLGRNCTVRSARLSNCAMRQNRSRLRSRLRRCGHRGWHRICIQRSECA